MTEIVMRIINAEREVARVVDAAHPRPGAFAVKDETTTPERAAMVRAGIGHPDPDKKPRRDALADTVFRLGSIRR